MGGWLTHGGLALETQAYFLAVVEHRLIPARVRSEWARLDSEGLVSSRAPASQESSHVGDAGVGVVSTRGAPVALPTFATAQFRRFPAGGVARLVTYGGYAEGLDQVESDDGENADSLHDGKGAGWARRAGGERKRARLNRKSTAHLVERNFTGSQSRIRVWKRLRILGSPDWEHVDTKMC